MRKSLPISIGTAAVVMAAAIAWRSGHHADEGSNLDYETKSVDRGSIIASVSATGTLSALVTVQVGSQVSGRIQQLQADYNDAVRKGDVLARIDPQLFEAAVEQARAAVTSARGNLDKATAQLHDAQRQQTRITALHDQGAASQADADAAATALENATAQVEVSRGALEQAQAAQHQSEINLAYTTITSPIDGTVIARAVDVGQTVAASLQAPTLFTIAEDMRQMQVDTNISEADVGKVRPGMTVTFVVDAYPGETFAGKIRQLRNAPQTLQNVVTYDAVIDVANADFRLKPGMTATVTMVYAERPDALRLPNAALRFKPTATVAALLPQAAPTTDEATATSKRGASRTIWVARSGRAVAIAIRTGISDGRFTEVLSGALEPGDQAITDATGSAAAAGAHRMF